MRRTAWGQILDLVFILTYFSPQKYQPDHWRFFFYYRTCLGEVWIPFRHFVFVTERIFRVKIELSNTDFQIFVILLLLIGFDKSLPLVDTSFSVIVMNPPFLAGNLTIFSSISLLLFFKHKKECFGYSIPVIKVIFFILHCVVKWK